MPIHATAMNTSTRHLAAAKAGLAERNLADPRWAGVVARNAEADGEFDCSVATTAAYCRPSCAPRLARPANVRFDATRADGRVPAGYRASGANAGIHFAIGACSLGSILVAGSERGVCAILIGDDPDALAGDLQDRFPRAKLIRGDADLERLVAVVVGFVEAPRIGLDLPLDVRGTAFQHKVWEALRAIPAGSTASYSEIAKRIHAPNAVRAVASACAANALAVAIPCHRVVRTDGKLSGYRWGVERKRALLEKEARG